MSRKLLSFLSACAIAFSNTGFYVSAEEPVDEPAEDTSETMNEEEPLEEELSAEEETIPEEDQPAEETEEPATEENLNDDEAEEEPAEEAAAEEADTEAEEIIIEESSADEQTYSSGSTKMADAPLISFDSTYYDSLTAASGSRWYRFTLPSSGRVTLNASVTGKSIAYSIKDSSGKGISQFSSSWVSPDGDNSTAHDKTDTFELKKGTYYLEIQGDSAVSGSNTFSLSFSSAGESFTEKDDTLDHPYEISLNTGYKGQIAITDSDYYRFELAAPIEITVNASAEMDGIFYRIYDSAKNRIWSKTALRKSSESSSAVSETVSLDQGTYYFAAELYAGSFGNYSFTINGEYKGFVTIGGKTYYYKNGSKVTGLQTISGKKYYFNSSGVMQKGWQTVNGKRYYFKTDGSAERGFKLVNGKYVYLHKPDAYVVTGFQTINGKSYYFDSNGYMFTGGWKQVSGKWYFFKTNGAAEGGWKKSGGKWYYLHKPDGAMLTGFQKIDGKTYYFSGSGAMLKGWQKISGKWYYMNGSGVVLTGWQKISGKWYYMNGSGVMLTGWQKISGKWYYMNSSGAMVTGWQKISNKWYYLNSSGAMVTGWQKISGKWYYFNSSGAMTTGWQQISGKWYYMNSSGAMVTGTQVIGGKTYHFNSSGVWIDETDTYNSYYDALMAYQKKYGEARLVDTYYTGMWYADLVDFNNDGKDELVIGASVPQNDHYASLSIFVFGYEGGRVKLLYKPAYNGGGDGAPGLISYKRYSHGTYLTGYAVGVSINGAPHRVYEYYGFYNNTFRVVSGTRRNLSTGEVTDVGPRKITDDAETKYASYAGWTNWPSEGFDGSKFYYDLSRTRKIIERCKNMQ